GRKARTGSGDQFLSIVDCPQNSLVAASEVAQSYPCGIRGSPYLPSYDDQTRSRNSHFGAAFRLFVFRAFGFYCPAYTRPSPPFGFCNDLSWSTRIRKRVSITRCCFQQSGYSIRNIYLIHHNNL